MSYINHSRQTNSGQNIVHSQFFKVARILVSFIVIAIICETAWLFTRNDKFLLSPEAFTIVAEALIVIAVFIILIWKGTKIIENAFIQRDNAMNALKENQAKFNSFVDANFIGIIEVNIDGSVCVANDKFLRITGYLNSYLQAGKLNWFDISPSEHQDLENQCFCEAKADGNCQPYYKDLICADGTRIKVKVGCTYVEDRINAPKYIIHVSECNQTEQNIFDLHWLEDLLDLIPAPLLLIEPGTARVTFANQAANKMAGGTFQKAQSQEEHNKLYRFSDAQGKPIPNELAPMIRVALGEKLEGVDLNWHEGDNIYQVKVFADALPPINGYQATCFALFQDITQLKQLEASLKLGNERLKLIFETTSDLISCQQPEQLIEVLYREIALQLNLDCYLYYLVDENYQQIQLNSYSGITCSQASYLERQKFGQGISGTVAQERRATNIERVSHYNLEAESIRSNGIVAYYCFPLIAQEQLLGTISFGSRTHSSFNDYEIGIMQAVCNQIASSIQRANLMNSLSNANRIKDEFLAILSHELRSPLNSILGWAQYLQIRKLDETTTSKALESIERNSRELNNVIEELLDMSQTIQGKINLNIQNCNLASIIATVLENLRSASLAKQIEIKFKLSSPKTLEMDKYIENATFTDTIESLKKFASLPTTSASDATAKEDLCVAGDRERLRQVIWNLLSNAIKFTSYGGCIEVRLLEEKAKDNSLPYAVIQVSDTGIGIDSEFIPYVFDRFRQGDSSSTRAHNGLGLGLSIVRHIVEMHGGSVFVESPGIGLGSTFTVKLPLRHPNELQSIKKKSKEKCVVIN
jgi:PAS domain S-box-containing protein